jgi:hypothetical protein
MASKTVKIKEIANRIFHFEFSTFYLMCSSLMRFEEYYESPKFKDKIFSLEDYMDYYAEQFGNFTYYSDVAGFNMPSYVFEAFFDGKFHPLLNKEEKVLNAIKNIKHKCKHSKFYIIGTCKQSPTKDQDLIHEIAHGLYYVNDEYRDNVQLILNKVKTPDIHAYLKKKGYHKAHFLDETHAFLIEDSRKSKRLSIDPAYKSIRRKLRDNFKKFNIPIKSKVCKFKI